MSKNKLDFLENITLDSIEEVITEYKKTKDVKLFLILEKLIKTALNINVEKEKINKKHYSRGNNILIATTADIIDRILDSTNDNGQKNIKTITEEIQR